MTRRRSLAALALAVSAALSVSTMTDVARAATVTTPAKITAVSARPGPGAGQVTFSWTSSGAYTTSFVIETALTSFKVGDARLPDHGRHAHLFTVPGTRRSVTLTAAQLASAGASVGSANHLYYRVKAVHATSKGTATRPWPYQQSVAVKPATPSSTGTPLRVASFNVRSAKTTGPTWLSRASLVAATIIARDPGVVALQELGPGRADGQAGSTTGTLRQTDSLLRALSARGGSKYRLVRTTNYIRPGTTSGSQGARILYDSTRYRLVSSCPETTAGSPWSTSCQLSLPVLAGDPSTAVRHGAYALLEDLATGQRFVVVSVHLDNRHSTTASTERALDALRAKQVSAVLARVALINPGHLPVVFGGDLNAWQNNQQGDRPHDALVSAGYFDTAAAATQYNVRWTTYNGFATTIPSNPSGWGARLDVIAVKGISSASRFENMMLRVQTHRASDHNMVVADIRLP